MLWLLSNEEISSPTIETVFYSISPETSFNFNTNVEITNELANEPTTTSTTIHSTDKETDKPTTIPMTSPITYKETDIFTTTVIRGAVRAT